MNFILRQALSTFVTVAITALAVAQGPGINYSKVQFIPQQLAPNVYILTGSPGADAGHPEAAGGRIGVLVGPEGVLMVDATYAPLPTSLPLRSSRSILARFDFW